MEFCKSQTYLNLAKSFAGEAQAGLRYQFIADLCTQQGYKIVADESRGLAKNEVNHAKVFFNHIVENGGNRSNIEITAGYPFEGKTIEEGLKFAVEAEKNEGERIYPAYQKVAQSEGFTEIARSFGLIAEVEILHEAKFKYLYENFQNGTLYKRNEPTMWQCSECGFVSTQNEAWDVCPLCSATQGFVELKLN